MPNKSPLNDGQEAHKRVVRCMYRIGRARSTMAMSRPSAGYLMVTCCRETDLTTRAPARRVKTQHTKTRVGETFHKICISTLTPRLSMCVSTSTPSYASSNVILEDQRVRSYVEVGPRAVVNVEMAHAMIIRETEIIRRQLVDVFRRLEILGLVANLKNSSTVHSANIQQLETSVAP